MKDRADGERPRNTMADHRKTTNAMLWQLGGDSCHASSHCCQNKDCLSGAPHTNKALVAYVMAECEPLARQ